MRRYIHTGILAGVVLLAGCGKEQYLDLTYDVNYWGGISTTFDGQEIPDLPKKQTAALLKICQQKPDLTRLPDRYVQHEGFDLYFLPPSIQGREFQHVRFLSDEKRTIWLVSRFAMRIMRSIRSSEVIIHSSIGQNNRLKLNRQSFALDPFQKK